MLIELINYFGTLQGFDAILRRFDSRDRADLNVMVHYLRAIHNVRIWRSPSTDASSSLLSQHSVLRHSSSRSFSPLSLFPRSSSPHSSPSFNACPNLMGFAGSTVIYAIFSGILRTGAAAGRVRVH